MAFWSNRAVNPARKYRFSVGPSGTNWWYVNSVTLPSFEINTNEYLLLNQNFKYPGVPTWSDVTISMIDVAASVKKISEVLGFQFFDFLQTDGIAKVTSAAALTKLDKKGSATPTEDNSVKQTKEKEKGKITAEKLFGRDSTDKKTENESTTKEAAELQKKGLSNATGLANNFTIQQLTEDGKVFRTWKLVNSFIKSVNYGELDYSSDDLVSVQIVIGYDYATTK